MGTRQQLQATLETITPNVYFDPPATIKMSYPAIIYKLTGIPTVHADNIKYFLDAIYTVILVDKNPDSAKVKSLLNLSYSSFESSYTAEGLHHWVFKITQQGVFN